MERVFGMAQRLASTALVVGSLMAVSVPGIGLARDHGGHSGGGHGYSGRSAAPSGGRGFSGGSHYSAPRGYSGGGHASGGFVNPRGYQGSPNYPAGRGSYGRGYYGGGYVAPRGYRAPYYHGYYGGGRLYFGYGAPYGYAYDPYYYAPAYPADPGYVYGPAPAPATPACTAGSYDQYGNWVPDPSCYGGQQQYPQQQYPRQQPQPNYGPNSQYPQQPYNP
jgi:hypothetical protein